MAPISIRIYNIHIILKWGISKIQSLETTYIHTYNISCTYYSIYWTGQFTRPLCQVLSRYFSLFSISPFTLLGHLSYSHQNTSSDVILPDTSCCFLYHLGPDLSYSHEN
uniref:Uncharacterized protein n=1 Tax=Cacopsylla melanoneura TaxID=428564 RepID=A0A8D8W6Y8_9HEMI